MSNTSKENVAFVMQHAKCDSKTAKLWLKHHKGSLGQAVIDARGDEFMKKINTGKVSMEDFCK